jgi:hypothetical protein
MLVAPGPLHKSPGDDGGIQVGICYAFTMNLSVCVVSHRR